MNALVDQRASKRYHHEAPVVLLDFRTDFSYNGTMLNYSTGGIYFESDYAPRPGRKIHIKVDSLPDLFSARFYLAEVRWRAQLAENPSCYSYGVGARYFQPIF